MRLGGHPLLEASNCRLLDPNLNSIALDIDAVEGGWNCGDAEAEEFTWSEG